MEKEKGKIGKFADLIKELYKTPRGKGILFFVGYFLFFLIFILIVRLSPRGEVLVPVMIRELIMLFLLKRLRKEITNFNIKS